jgi:hypothetical protein
MIGEQEPKKMKVEGYRDGNNADPENINQELSHLQRRWSPWRAAGQMKKQTS